MLPATIATDRLTLEACEYAFPEHVHWLNDRRHMQYSEQRHLVHSLKSQQDYVQTCSKSLHVALWNIRSKKEKTIGTVTADIDFNNQVGDVGILIGPTFNGYGYGKEAFGAATRWLFDPSALRLRKVEGGCMENNRAMQMIFLYCGFSLEGRREKHFLSHGKPLDCLLFGRLADTKYTERLSPAT